MSESGDEEESSDSFDLFGPFKATTDKAAVADGDSEGEAVQAQEWTDSDEADDDGLVPGEPSNAYAIRLND